MADDTSGGADSDDLPVLKGRYEIHTRIAQGGMADVFLGRDQLLDRPVAVKVLFPEYSNDPAFVERFRREAQAAANLSHPNIVNVYDWGEHRDTYFIVMEYVEGRTLSQILRTEGPLHPDRAAEVAMDMAAALSFAHRNGVVHRDVKSGNVLITADGQVKVADFGIAEAITGGQTEPAAGDNGAVLGTAAYFSPEQAQGKRLDPRSDLYSLGIVVYEMLTTRTPFAGGTPQEIARKQVYDAPPAPTEQGVDIPAPLEAITLKLLAKNPANRYASAEDVRTDLRRYREGQPVMAEPVMAAAATEMLEREHAAVLAPEPIDMKSRVGLYSGLLVFLLVALSGLVFMLVGELRDDHGPQVEVRTVVGENITEAKRVLEEDGFEVRTRFEENEEVDSNIVFDQDPGGGSKARRGSVVTLFVSSGRNAIEVPSVVGLQIDGARIVLMQRGFQVEAREEFSATIPAGEVYEQDPAGEQRAPRGSVVTLTFSKGPEPVPVPNVVGMPELKAANELGKLGFNVESREEPNTTVPPGTVFATEPPPETLVPPGSTIVLLVAGGGPEVPVPNVVGRSQAEATALLNQAGLNAVVEAVPVAFNDPNVGRVLSQLPESPAVLPQGSVVAIRVAVALPEPTTTTSSSVPVTTTTRPPTTTTTQP
jgi:serine/threonine-protein kinase